MDAQLTATKGMRARAESLWMACASRSLPVPVSPRIITGMSRSTMRRSFWMTDLICASPVSRYCNDDRCGLQRDCVGVAVRADDGVAPPSCSTGASEGCDHGPAGLISVRHQTDTPLCIPSWRGIDAEPLNNSNSAEMGRLKSEEKVCACRAWCDRPSWNCALRLAEMKRPSGENTAMPSTSVPRNSGRE